MNKTENIARGAATRSKNKELRRTRILSSAGTLIAEHGFDGFTLSQLADHAEVTVPTIHNLIGKKSDLCRELVEGMVNQTAELIDKQQGSDPIEFVELFIGSLIELYSVDENLYKAAFIAGEREQLFEQELPTGIFAKSLKLAEKVCGEAVEKHHLKGLINVNQLATQLFSCQRIARHDWMHGYIDLEAYHSQVLVGMYITLAADAEPEFHVQLIDKLQSLSG
jgi:AcrR family transcriptional regulator